MMTSDARHNLEERAAQALMALLQESSAIKLREIRHQSTQTRGDCGFVAYVDVYGNRHTLACEVRSDGRPRHLRLALEQLRNGAPHLLPDTSLFIIAPYLSPEAQAICKENMTGFLDLEGNASLALGEAFIVKRSLPRQCLNVETDVNGHDFHPTLSEIEVCLHAAR